MQPIIQRNTWSSDRTRKGALHQFGNEFSRMNPSHLYGDSATYVGL